ncbi:MAG: DUF2085 domain-containing protein [Caldilineaceae bacterium]|nr:DUF2085 domain-containing protein [Caldilineaceae bacterium]
MKNASSSQLVPWIDYAVTWFLHHWLAVVLTFMLLFTLGPFLAPAAMAAGHKALGQAIYTFYIPFCHQLPQRSWFLFGDKLTYTLAEISRVYPDMDLWRLRFFYGNSQMGWKVAWSDRMLSFYTMTPVFGLLYAWRRNRRPLAWQLLLLMLLPLAVDGFSHLINDALYGLSGVGFRDTNGWLAALTGNRWPSFYAGDQLGTFNWWMRLLTGLLAAWGLAFFAFPGVDKLIDEEIK